jgi:transglutaminase-like putative cysteine protease
VRKLFFFFLYFFILLLFPAASFAASNFSADYFVTYNILPSTLTNVSVSGSLTNLTDDYYASSYKIQLGFKDISNLQASDETGQINAIVVKNARGSSVELPFNSKVVGQGRKLSFNLSFNTSEVAQAQGKVWEINIPGLSAQNDFKSFNATVLVPSFLGKPAYIKPPASATNAIISGNKLTFTKDDLGTSGISVAFGEAQIYNFNLTYHLENKNLFPVRTEIAIPPSTNYQDVLVNFMSPKPVNVTIDKDGNWLAEYRLSPSQTSAITVRGTARLSLTPKEEVLSENAFSEYLKQKKYWESSSNKIKDIALKLRTPKAIYDYVVENLKYDFSRVTGKKPRLGALNVLDDPTSAVCLEFTDLFIALSRSAGIPAREIDGYAFTKNTEERPLSLVEDVLHAWPEYYDSEKKSWIMIDPTWGNTTGGVDYLKAIDFDHFAFVLKGYDSLYPIPAGGYKLAGTKDVKDVFVSLGKEFNQTKTLQISLDIPDIIYTGIPVNGELKIVNTGNSITDKTTINISSKYLTGEKSITLEKIPPYGFKTIPLDFIKQPILTNKTDTITIHVDGYNLKKNVKITPLFLNKWILIEGVLIVSFFIVLSLIIKRTGRIPLSRGK